MAPMLKQAGKFIHTESGKGFESVSIVALLKACAKKKDLCTGAGVHADILKRGILAENTFVASALVNMYAKCGALAKSKDVLEGLPVRDVFTWNALIAGYAQGEHGKEALTCFKSMQLEGVSPDAVTFTCILKSCGSIRALDKGINVHLEIGRRGLLGQDVVLGGALVDMYAKCGALAKAMEVLEELPVRDVVTWSALTAGYVEGELTKEAIHCFEQMQSEGISPNSVTFLCALKACGSLKALNKGRDIHFEIHKQGLLSGNAMLGNALVVMYARCGALAKAKKVLEGLSCRDMVSWSALISAYAQAECGKEALNCFEQMQREGFSPDVMTFTSILKACGILGALDQGEDIHSEIVRQGLLCGNVVLCGALVDMYAKCGAFAKANEVLDGLPVRDIVCWSALISEYVQEECIEEALYCFELMQCEGHSPNLVTLGCILKACGKIKALDKGEGIHYEITRQGLLNRSAVLGGYLVDMYVRCGALVKAKSVFDGLPVRNVASWNALISGYTQGDDVEEALDCFGQLQYEGLLPDAITFGCVLKACGSLGELGMGLNIHLEIARHRLLDANAVLGGALVDMYARCGALAEAKETHDALPVRDLISWNALITGYVQEELGNEALSCFQQMQCEGLSPDSVTFSCILKACGNIGSHDKGEHIHTEVARQGFVKNTIICGALVDMYTKCGALVKAKEVLEGSSIRDVVSWSALISGYVQGELAEEALSCFERMQQEGLFPNMVTLACILKACGSLGAVNKGEGIHMKVARQGLLSKNVVLGNALVVMYSKCGALTKAKEVLEGLLFRDVVSWSALMAGYVQQEDSKEALHCFERMEHEGLSLDEVTYMCILKACGAVGALGKGKNIHTRIADKGLLDGNVVHGYALVSMYAKCGALVTAKEVLEGLPVRNVASWNALIAGYTQIEHGKEALCCFEQMQQEGLFPDEITFVLMLNLCCRSCFLDEGKKYFSKMSECHGILPNAEHLVRILNLLGCVGLLNKAAAITKIMSSSNVPIVFLALLNACEKWGHVVLGSWAFEHAMKMDMKVAIYYVYMSNIYAATGMMEEANKVGALRVMKQWDGIGMHLSKCGGEYMM